jgi:LmbE family N-acetylglucosaminyl deacetylase
VVVCHRQDCRLCRDAAPRVGPLPWRRDPHRDHRDAHALTAEALRRSGLRPRLLEYAIWLDELGAEGDRPHPGEVSTIRFDIGPWRSRKRAAVAAQRSQLGLVVQDDPHGFVLSSDTVDRLTGSAEVYFEAWA